MEKPLGSKRKSKRQDQEKRNGKKLDNVILPNLPGMAYRCRYDHNWTMLFVSEGCYDLTGYTPEELIDNAAITYNQIVNPEYREPIWKEWEQALAQRATFRYEYEITTASGNTKWVLETGRGIFNADGLVDTIEGIIIDVSERKERELQIKYLYEHDPVTGLYNRRYFEEILSDDAALKQAETRAVVLVSLRRFTSLNITYGYHYGENLVNNIVRDLLKLCNDSIRLFHISIDRYAFYITGYEDQRSLVDFCSSVTGVLGALPMLKTIGWRIGIYEIGQEECDPDSIIKNAMIASSNVIPGASGYSFFDSEMENRLLRLAAIKEELTSVVSADDDPRFYLVFQPVLDLKRDRISGFEALARLRSDTLGEISPVEFIPIAEETALIIPLGRKIMRMALEFRKKLLDAGHADLMVSINISTIQLLDDQFIASLVEALEEANADPENLCLEITESVFSSNYDEINSTLNTIRKFGIKVALDDFGTGYSSLSREKELSIDIVKVDRYFIGKLDSVSSPEAITSDIISMVHKLGHTAVAEGVEYTMQKMYLIKNDCDMIQGHLISKPLTQKDAMDFLCRKHFG